MPTPTSSPRKRLRTASPRKLRPRVSFHPEVGQTKDLEFALGPERNTLRSQRAWQRQARTVKTKDGKQRRIYKRFDPKPTLQPQPIRAPKSPRTPSRPVKRSLIGASREDAVAVPSKFEARSTILSHKIAQSSTTNLPREEPKMDDEHDTSEQHLSPARSNSPDDTLYLEQTVSGDEAYMHASRLLNESPGISVSNGLGSSIEDAWSDCSDSSVAPNADDDVKLDHPMSAPIAFAQLRPTQEEPQDSSSPEGPFKHEYQRPEDSTSQPLEILEDAQHREEQSFGQTREDANVEGRTQPEAVDNSGSISGILELSHTSMNSSETPSSGEGDDEGKLDDGAEYHGAPLDDRAESVSLERRNTPADVEADSGILAAHFQDDLDHTSDKSSVETSREPSVQDIPEAASAADSAPTNDLSTDTQSCQTPENFLNDRNRQPVQENDTNQTVEPSENDIDFNLVMNTSTENSKKPSNSGSTVIKPAQSNGVASVSIIAEHGDISQGSAVTETGKSSMADTYRSEAAIRKDLEITEEITVSKILLNDDTTMLQDFLERTRASKAARLKKRESDSNKRDSDVIKHALASPRKVLEDIDTNSPVVSQKLRDAASPISHIRSPPPPIRDEEDTINLNVDDTLNGIDELSQPEPVYSRRRTRGVPSRVLPEQGETQTIELPRTKPFIIRRTEAQELANLTRNNTRRNKGSAISAPAMLDKLRNAILEDDVAERKDLPGRRNVTWNDVHMVQIFGEGNPASSGVETAAARSQKRGSKRARALGAVNGTPAKSRRLGSAACESEHIDAQPETAEDAERAKVGEEQGSEAVFEATTVSSQKQKRLPLPTAGASLLLARARAGHVAKSEQENEHAGIAVQSKMTGSVSRSQVPRRSVLPRRDMRTRI